MASFATDDVGEFLPAFAAALQATAVEPFFPALGRALYCFWTGFCARRGLAAAAPVARDPGDESPQFTCGAVREFLQPR